MIIQSISDVFYNDLCMGCGTCSAICPEQSIKLELNPKKGTYVPKIDAKKCNNCNKCYSVCPGYYVDFDSLNLEIFKKIPANILIGNILENYLGHSQNNYIRFNSSSGGVVTQLLITALENGFIDGALVTRMKETNPLEAEPFIARTKKEILESSKSKYCPVPSNEVLIEILNSKKNEKFAIVGTSCQIQGIRKAQKINPILKEKIVLCFGLFCGKRPTYIGTEFLMKTSNISKKEISKLSYRGKGWPGYFSVEMKDNTKTDIPYTIAFSILSLFTPKRCFLCNDGSSELADISFADAWIPNLLKNNAGESMIIVRSEKGRNFINRIKNKNISLKNIDNAEINSTSHEKMLNFKKKSISARLKILKFLGKEVPLYDNKQLLSPNSKDYVNSIISYIKYQIAMKKFLWPLMSFIIRRVIQSKKGIKLGERID
ncbi:Coenzyme F420 hydrogenase/dehydrogenase, beta subunit C-terminal domain [Methanobacterium alcaliphilum]|uniref:Coenzyme F420 hydrogenase/dehydrogenase, beta subunit C-terminal domain n=1 Tax=Methanobacterium alcaliphilum TaxID=392018 RepID=UPI00200ADC53|nr:Coenzyme F420 hydrogenase/dehydrogenase, beta subunit C-terminal domain [Methanobacterium alcaliphilum]MCK9150773.1 Coenzyme F420 hydrogenase/dehydrogenase, beta subunit C-terminal domain [Methanobacterium alcaliphilum]